MTNIKIDFKGKPKVSAEFGKPKSSSITAKAGAKTQGLPSAKYSRASSQRRNKDLDVKAAYVIYSINKSKRGDEKSGRDTVSKVGK